MSASNSHVPNEAPAEIPPKKQPHRVTDTAYCPNKPQSAPMPDAVRDRLFIALLEDRVYERFLRKIS